MKLTSVLNLCWLGGLSTKSDAARVNADYIAIAAREGLITTETDPGSYGKRWYVTPRGLAALFKEKGMRS